MMRNLIIFPLLYSCSLLVLQLNAFHHDASTTITTRHQYLAIRNSFPQQQRVSSLQASSSSSDDEMDRNKLSITTNNSVLLSRRDAFVTTALTVTAAATASVVAPAVAAAAEETTTITQIPITAETTTPIAAETTVTTTSSSTGIPIRASWSSVDGLNSNVGGKETTNTKDKKGGGGNFVSFDMSAYKAMKEDPTRTPIFQKAIEQRLIALKGQGTVLDLGTGPFALFALLAAELGAARVYAIEADPAVAASARTVIAKAGYTDVITVIEGISTEVTLPEQVDVCIAEICGSICTEEGVVATIQDAHQRFVKVPNSPSSWIPSRLQTYAAPASYTLHTLFGPPEFDWAKLKGEPVRFNCRDEGLQLLSNPVVVEDVSFADIMTYKQEQQKKKNVVTYTVDAKRIEANYNPLFAEFRRGQSSVSESNDLAASASTTFSGIAMWPRLFLSSKNEKDDVIINSRGYPLGDHQRSHWQTVLPIMADRPVGKLVGGETITVDFDFDVPTTTITQPAKYSIIGTIEGVTKNSSNTAAAAATTV